jgi:threonine/homoserine/homoserine lactone efflux protein
VTQFEVEHSPGPGALQALRSWTSRQALAAVIATFGVALAIGVPTDVIPNPVFGRPVPVTWWSYPTLAITAILGGLLAATYVREPTAIGPGPAVVDEVDASTRTGGVAGLLSFFAVGCPVCNKLVLVALGTTGARQWFEPVQPLLAVASIGLLWWALSSRLRNASSCRLG